MLECVWEISKIIMWDTMRIRPCSTGTYILVGSYMLTTFIIVNEYLGAMTSLITATPYKWTPINSLEDFKESNLLWLGNNKTATTKL